MPTSEEQTRPWIDSCTDRKALQQFAKNAEKKGRSDLRDIALKRSWKLEGLDHPDALAKDFYAMLAAYEHFLFLKHHKHVKAARTRQKLENKGIEGSLQDWALADKPTEGFLRLVEAGLAEFTGECVILRHAEHFDASVVSAAKKRLKDFGVTDCSRPNP